MCVCGCICVCVCVCVFLCVFLCVCEKNPTQLIRLSDFKTATNLAHALIHFTFKISSEKTAQLNDK